MRKDFVNGWTPVVLLVFFSLGIRIPFLDMNAYWYDELLSVLIYGANHETLADAIRFLGKMSVHPPLYQTSLYLWMSAFGASEFATRLLSTLYMVGGTLFVLGAVKTTHGRALGYLAALVFTLSYMALYYSLETRSYAQTTLLAAASLYFAVRYVATGRSAEWRSIVLDRSLLLMSLANTGLLLTHYHNVTYIAAQGLFLAVVVAAGAGRRWPSALLYLAVLGMLPVLAYAAIWGTTFLETVARKDIGGARATRAPLPPAMMFWQYVFLPNFASASLSKWSALPFLAAAAVQPVWRLLRRSGSWHGLIYPVMTILPLFIAWLVFLKIGDQKSAARYFIFVTPALAASLAVGLGISFQLLSTVLPAKARHVFSKQLLVFLIPLSLLIVGPGAYSGLRATKVNYGVVDYRNTARTIANIIGSKQRDDVLLIEVGRRDFLNYYLSQFSKNRAISFYANNVKSEDVDLAQIPKFTEANEIIVAYVHERLGRDQAFRAALSEKADLVANLIHPNKRGIQVYRRSPSESISAAAPDRACAISSWVGECPSPVDGPRTGRQR